MATVERINKFVSKMMDKYSMPLYHYFDDCGEGDEGYVVFKNNRTDEKTIKKVCRLLGVTEKEIREVDIEAADRWYNKYEFFKLFLQYRTTNYYAQFGLGDAEARLMKAIFGEHFTHTKKYREEVIKRRIIETLTEVDEIIPGTLHKNAEIVNLHYEVADFISFRQVESLVRSFIELVERHKELFYKIWNVELAEDEIREYDFLTSCLRATDAAKAGGLMYYAKVKELLPIMREENYTEYSSYVQIPSSKDFLPWTCIEFTDNVYLAQKYVDIFPRTKRAIQKFCMQIKNIHCFFAWSDSFKPLDEIDWDDLADEMAEQTTIEDLTKPIEEFIEDLNNEPTPWINIYVKKTAEELGDDFEYAQKLSVLAGPSSKGGLTVKPREYSVDEQTQRMIKRVSAGIKKTEED